MVIQTINNIIYKIIGTVRQTYGANLSKTYYRLECIDVFIRLICTCLFSHTDWRLSDLDCKGIVISV